MARQAIRSLSKLTGVLLFDSTKVLTLNRPVGATGVVS